MSVYDKVKTEISNRGSGNGDLFVKLAEDGAKMVGTFRGEPFIREVFWNGERYEQKTDDTPSSQKTTLRISQNMAILEEGKWMAKIIEQSQRFFQGVMTVDDKYGVENWCFEVVRKGAAGDTNTTYSILPESELNASQKKEIAALDLFDLERVLSGGDAVTTSQEADDETMEHVMTILKGQTKEVVGDFMKKFGIAKIRDLKTHQMEDVTKYLESLSSDDDPFA